MTIVIQWIISALVLAGALFCLVAAMGVVRMPDVYCRMHTATKAGAFGVTLLLLALMASAPEPRVIIQSILVIIFFYLTSPVASQLLGHVAINAKLPLWKHLGQAKADGPKPPPPEITPST